MPKPRWVLWCTALVLGALGTAWLYAASPGINWALATLVVSLGLATFWRVSGRCQRLDVVLPLALACFIALGAAVTASATTEALIAGCILCAIGSAVVAAYARRTRSDGPITWVIAAPCAYPLALAEAGHYCNDAIESVRAGQGVPVIRGAAIAIPITLVLALLLSAADPTFASIRDAVSQALRDASIIPRLAFFCGLSACLIGSFGIAAQPTFSGAALTASEAPVAASRPTVGGGLTDTEPQIILGSVAILFGIFLVLQISYLFGDPGGTTGSGLSYADAVHRGFVELNLASTLCVVLLLTLRRYAASTQPSRAVRLLEWIVIAQGQVLLVSAFYRVDLYEGAYGFTRLRLYVQAYAAVAFVALIFLTVEMRHRPLVDRLLRRVMVVGLMTVGALIFVNSDAWIARANLQRYARVGRIDVPYLTIGLGPDAVPEVVAALPHLPTELQAGIKACLRTQYPDEAGRDAQRWFEWSLRRAQLRSALSHIGTSSAGAPTQPIGTSPPRDVCAGYSPA
jgi:two-component system, OmpR family, sensor histidine kinase BaeS